MTHDRGACRHQHRAQTRLGGFANGLELCAPFRLQLSGSKTAIDQLKDSPPTLVYYPTQTGPVPIQLQDLEGIEDIQPFDAETVVRSVEKTHRAVIVHEAPRNCGLGAEIASQLMEHCFLHLEAPIQRVTGFDAIMPYYKLELDYLPEAERIERALDEVAAY